jgi:hypothetical protein
MLRNTNCHLMSKWGNLKCDYVLKLNNFNVLIMAWHGWWTSHTFAPLFYGLCQAWIWEMGPWTLTMGMGTAQIIWNFAKFEIWFLYETHKCKGQFGISLIWYPSWTSKPFFSNGDGFYTDGNGDLFGKKFVFIYKWKDQYHYLMVYKQVD